MRTTKGIVQEIDFKPEVGKTGMTRFSVKDDAGVTAWYGKFGQLGMKAGDTVELGWDFDKTGKYRNVETIVVVGTSPVGSNATPAGLPAVTKDSYWERKESSDVVRDRRIGWCWAITAATEILKMGPSGGKYADTNTAHDAVLAEAYKLHEALKAKVNGETAGADFGVPEERVS